MNAKHSQSVALSVLYEGRFFRDNSGKIYTRFESDSYKFWAEMLDTFDNVKVFARVIPSADLSSQNFYRVDGDNVKVVELKDYNRKAIFLNAGIYNIIRMITLLLGDDRILLWGVGPLAVTMSMFLLLSGRRYALRILGDPDAVFSDPTIRLGCRHILRVVFAKAQKQLAEKATVMSYVTSFVLAEKYPSGNKTSKYIFPDTNIKNIDILEKPRDYSANGQAKKLITIASLEQLYKGVDLLIKALAICKERSELFSLTLVGDGRYKQYLKSLSRMLGVSGQIVFKGWIGERNKVFDLLDKSDIFVLLSRTEGLPRALIEAMARGLPCICSKAGGIPELLCQEDLVDINEVDQFVIKLIKVSKDPEKLRRMSQRNLEKVREYSREGIQNVKKSFFHRIKMSC